MDTYTTGQMIDLVFRDKELIFEAISGQYDGQITFYHDDIEWLMWKNNRTYEPIILNNEFMKTKWKLLGHMYAVLIDMPLVNIGKGYCIFQ